MWCPGPTAKRKPRRVAELVGFAKAIDRPVRIQLTRSQMYSMAGHQPATIQTIALGADRDGKLVGIEHQSISPDLPLKLASRISYAPIDDA
jgi:CO/xanthine dehydrogenase Mo-binding subunit